jgi:glucan phosphoethanolaminetransferase (alkaline phosphatase superfamily)
MHAMRALALDCLLIVVAMILLAFSILLTRIFALDTQLSVATGSANMGYILVVACLATGLTIAFQPSHPSQRIIFLATILAALTLLNAIDLTFIKYFRQPAITVYPYLPRTGATVATLPAYGASLRQYVPAPFLVLSLLLIMPAFLLFHLMGFRASRSRLPAVVSTAIVLTISIAPLYVRSSTVASDPLTSTILRVDPNIARRSLRSVDRTHSFTVPEVPRYKPRTIVLIINENTSFFNRSAEDSRIALIDRIIGLSGDKHVWNIYRNALTNSPCTDVSLPSILTGSGSHETFAKLHQMPFLFDMAKARGYRTAFYTSAIMEWANLSTFLSHARIDSLLTGSQTGLPMINDLAVDDIAVMRRLAALVRGRPEEEHLFIVVYSHGMHTPYQSEADLEFPPSLLDRRSRALYVLENNHRILFDALRDMGRLAGALIIATADHGEPIPRGSRRLLIPRVDNYGEETLRVPLLIKEPADLPAHLAAGLRANAGRLVSNADIAPTIADLLGVQLQGGLTYSGYSLLQKVPETRLSVATGVNEWRSWPHASFALARGTDRFTCDHRKLCTYYSISPAEEAAMTPFERRMKYFLYMDEAQKLPIIAQNLSRIYHAHFGVAWSPPQGTVRVATRSDLFSSLGELLAQPPGGAILHAPAGHAAGHIMYGPYWMLPAGQYTADVSLEIGSGGEDGEHLCTMDIYDGARILETQEIRQESAPGARTVVVTFTVPDGASAKRHEIRLWCAGKTSIAVNRVALARAVATSRGSSPSPSRYASPSGAWPRLPIGVTH